MDKDYMFHDELKEFMEIVCKGISKRLNLWYRNCKIEAWFIDTDNILIKSEKDGTVFQQFYINGLDKAIHSNDFVISICRDFSQKYDKWILRQYKGY